MKKLAIYLKTAEAKIDISIDKYLKPYKEKIENIIKETEESQQEISLYEEHLKAQMQKITSGLQSVNLSEVFVSGGSKKNPIGHFSIRSPQMDEATLEKEIKQLGFKNVKIERQIHDDSEWLSVVIKLESFDKFIERKKSISALDILFRNDVVSK